MNDGADGTSDTDGFEESGESDAADAADESDAADAADESGEADADATEPPEDEPAEVETPSDAVTVSPAADVPPIDELTGDVRRLDPRVRVTWLVGAGAIAVVLGALAGVAAAFATVSVWLGPAVAVVVFALGVAHAIARYRIWRYEVRDDALYLDRGVLTRVRTVVPHVRIQHVDASRGPLERALGLSSVVVYTAGSRGADVTVPGLTADEAEDLQTRLKHLAIAAGGEDAV